jgi:hypothetical protein
MVADTCCESVDLVRRCAVHTGVQPSRLVWGFDLARASRVRKRAIRFF